FYAGMEPVHTPRPSAFLLGRDHRQGRASAADRRAYAGSVNPATTDWPGSAQSLLQHQAECGGLARPAPAHTVISKDVVMSSLYGHCGMDAGPNRPTANLELAV